MPLPAHLRVEVKMSETATGNAARIILYYKVQSGDEPTVETIQDYANDFKTAFTAAIPSALPTTHRYDGVFVRWLGVAADIEAHSEGAAANGIHSGGVHPEEVAACIQRRTGVKGRMNRGRIFMPFVPLSFAAGSTLTNAGETAYKAVGTMIHGQVTTSGGENEAVWRPCTPNFKQNVLNPIVQTRVLNELCSRRDRRYVKRGVPIAAPAPVS